MKTVKFNNFEQIDVVDLNNIGAYELNINQINIVKEFISGGKDIITSGLQVQFISGNTLKISDGQGASSNGSILFNDNGNFELLASNPQFDDSLVPADVTNGNIFITEIQFVLIDGASELRNFIDASGNTFSQVVVKEQLVEISARIREGSSTVCPSVVADWTKISEVKKIGSGDYTIYNVDSYFDNGDVIYDNSDWTADKQVTHLVKPLALHRSDATLDHPFKSVTEDHLTETLQSKINASTTSGGSSFDDIIAINLLNKGSGEDRDNESMEYYLGTGLDTDYFESKSVVSKYNDQLLNDNGEADAIDEYDDNNTSSSSSLTNLICEIYDGVNLFDVYLYDTDLTTLTKVMTGVSNDFDWTLENLGTAITGGHIVLVPQSTWGAFKSGNDSISGIDTKIIGANDTTDGLEKSSSLVDIEILFNKAVFDSAFQGTSDSIVITKDFQVYSWDNTGVPADALISDKFVFGYEMFLRPSEDGGVTAKVGSVAGENDAGWHYIKIATNKHRVYTPINEKLFLSVFNDGDCVGVGGDKYFDKYGSKAYTMKTQVYMQDGFYFDGFHRYLSIIKFDETESEWVSWAGFFAYGESGALLENINLTERISILAKLESVFKMEYTKDSLIDMYDIVSGATYDLIDEEVTLTTENITVHDGFEGKTDNIDFAPILVDVINEKTTDAGVIVDGVLLKDGDTYTDNIFEKTPANGVTVDGVVLKDGNVNVNIINELGAGSGVTVDGVALKDGAIKTDNIFEKKKKIPIGDWDMNVSASGTATVNLPHGLDYTKITHISAIIINDTNTLRVEFSSGADNILATSANIQLQIATGSYFDNTAYDSTSFNRGSITVIYEL